MMKAENKDVGFGALGRVFLAGDRVVVSFILMYGQDFGAANAFPLCHGKTKHPGDAEQAALELELTGRAGEAIVRGAFTTGHAGTPDDQTRIFRGADLKILENVKDAKTAQARWRVYASQAKHATYATKSLCENAKFSSWTHQFCGNEDCAPDRVSDPERFTKLPAILNVGEKDGPRANDLSKLGFPGESAWGSQRFCGGTKVPDRNACPGPLAGKLVKNPFTGR
jgi:hypothetical protein